VKSGKEYVPGSCCYHGVSYSGFTYSVTLLYRLYILSHKQLILGFGEHTEAKVTLCVAAP